ncbi:MAG: hypothetical protein ABTR27_03400 [Candidatus Competibacter phosphatis]
MMFSSEHAIWKFAYAGGELDDWLPYAEDLIREWSVQNKDEIKFDSFQIALAALLLKDDLLPAPARAAFADAVWEAMNDAFEKKYTLKSLHIHPPKSGMKKMTLERLGFIMLSVSRIIRSGKNATQAYQEVADKCFVSPDTIRRVYERQKKKSQKRGEIKK